MNKKLLMALSVLFISLSGIALEARWGHYGWGGRRWGGGGFGFGIGLGYPYGYGYPSRTVIVERPVVEKRVVYVAPSTPTYVDESVPMTSTKSDNYWVIHNLTNKDITVTSEKATVPMNKNEEAKKLYHGGNRELTISIGGQKTRITNVNGRVLNIYLDKNGTVKIETKS